MQVLASHKSSKSVICDQNVQGCVVDYVICHIDKNNKVGGAKLLGSKNQVAAISDKIVTSDSNGDNSHKSIMSGVNATVSEQSNCIPLFDVKVSCDDDKFLNSVLMNRKKSALCTKSVYFNSWRNQTDFDFGFLLISEFVMPAVVADRSHRSLSPIIMHNMVKASGQPNYLHFRIPVPSQLKISAWKKVLQGYWDSQLVQLVWLSLRLQEEFSTQL